MNTKTITPIHVCDLIAHETVSLLSVLDEDAVPPAQWMRDGLALYVAAHQLEEETAVSYTHLTLPTMCQV